MKHDVIRILFVEDAPEDVELEERELRKAGLGFRSRRVETCDALETALAEFKPDLVISDFSLPKLDGLSALRIVRAGSLEIPFIFVSGTIGEERAIESLKNGATDYVVKDSLAGLPSKVNRALREARERADHRRVEEELRQAQKMEAVGRLAGGVAHDFNNLLTVINGYSQLMLGQLPPEGPLRDQAQEILKAGERAASLTRQLLMFSRKQALAPAVVNLNAVLAQVERMLRRLIGANIQLVTTLHPDLGHVKVDRGQIEQVVLNLSLNARDAMPSGGKLVLETSNVLLDAEYAQKHPGVAAGPHVMLSVRDTGTGMDAEALSHLFEPFFTTKEHGKGTGLGLSTVYGIVRQTGGHIRVRSEPGQGTTFEVVLPRVEGLPTPAPLGSASPEAAAGSETVLLVEDSESVRKLITAMLARQGYRVLVAGDGEAALRLIQESPGSVHLVITDVLLPGMSGPEMVQRAMGVRPGIKVLFTSGYTDREVSEKGVLEGAAFLQKPFDSDTLARKVRAVLDEPDQRGAS